MNMRLLATAVALMLPCIAVAQPLDKVVKIGLVTDMSGSLAAMSGEADAGRD